MLLRFGMSNWYSIRDYQEVILTASAVKDRGVDLLRARGFPHNVLPSIGLYGANASGKSNVLTALRFLRTGVIRSHTAPREGPIGRDPFKLDPKFRTKPTKIDCDFILGNMRFQYGFSVSDTRVEEEWLFAYALNQERSSRQTWFHRNIKTKPTYYFGNELKGKNKTIEALTRPDSLFLSTAAQNNHEQLGSIHSYFKDRIVFIEPDDTPSLSEIAKHLQKDDKKQVMLNFLKFADTGIADAKIEHLKTNKDRTAFTRELREVLTKHIKGVDLRRLTDDDQLSLKLLHRGAKGNALMDLSDESAGTRVLLGVLGPVFDALSTGKTLIVDELNTSMHTLVSRKLVSLFGSKHSNIGNGQLVFATHDTNILCAGILRRDQVWFTEKGPDGATKVYPLTDIRTRQTDNIEKGYLQGRFGAIPFFADVT